MLPFCCTHCSSIPTLVPTVLLCLLFLCASVPTVPLCPLFLCSSVPTVPLCPLFLCAHCSSVPTVPLCPLFLCVYCSSVPLNLLFLCSPVLTVTLITSVRSSYMSHKPALDKTRSTSFSASENLQLRK